MTPCTCSLAHPAAVRAARRSVHSVYYHTNAPPQHTLLDHCCRPAHMPRRSFRCTVVPSPADTCCHLCTAACTQLYIDGPDRRLACCRPCCPAEQRDARRRVCAVHSAALSFQSAACLQSVPWPRVHPGRAMRGARAGQGVALCWPASCPCWVRSSPVLDHALDPDPKTLGLSLSLSLGASDVIVCRPATFPGRLLAWDSMPALCSPAAGVTCTLHFAFWQQGSRNCSLAAGVTCTLHSGSRGL